MATRKLTYYSADETTNNLFTTGQQWMTTDEREYRGAYHKYLTGEVFTEAKWNPKKSKPLIPYVAPVTNKYNRLYRTLKPKIKTLYDSPKSQSVTITQKDIDAGVINRYFYKRYDNDKILETTESLYNEIISNQVDKKLYVTQKIQWFITGNKNDQFKNGVFIAGVSTKNINQVKFAAKTLPGLTAILTDPLQYYTDTDFIAPVDINGLDS